MSNIKKYGIFDCACEPKVLSMIDNIESPCLCLYPEPIDDKLKNHAPYLIEVTEEVEEYIIQHGMKWGVYFTTKYSSIIALRNHLRNYLSVIVPTFKDPILLRYYDPRVFWIILDTLTPKDRSEFEAPMLTIETYYIDELEGYFPREKVISQKSNNLNEIVADTTLSLNEKQYENILSVFCDHKAIGLSHKMKKWIDKYPLKIQENELNKVHTFYREREADETMSHTNIDISLESLQTFSKQLIKTLESWGIYKTRSVNGIAQLCISKQILSMKEFPSTWKKRLLNKNQPEVYRAYTFLQEELGFIPTLSAKGETND